MRTTGHRACLRGLGIRPASVSGAEFRWAAPSTKGTEQHVIDDITLGLILSRFQQLCSGRSLGVLSVSRDPQKENGLIYNTLGGVLHGTVSEKDDCLVLRVGDKEVLVPTKVLLSRLQ